MEGGVYRTSIEVAKLQVFNRVLEKVSEFVMVRGVAVEEQI